MNESNSTSEIKTFRWTTPELVAIGVFAALIRIAGLSIVLASGGMNPIGLILLGAVSTALLIVLLHKSPVTGTLTLYILIYALFSILVMGSGLDRILTVMLAAIIVDLLSLIWGGYNKTWKIILAVGLLDLISRGLVLIIVYLVSREYPGMILIAFLAICSVYAGNILGLFVGRSFVKELRIAGVIRR